MNKERRLLIEDLLKEEILHIEDLNKGLTNKNYLVSTLNHQVVVRIPPQDTQQIVHRKHEYEALQRVKDLDLETLYYDQKSGLKITRYIQDLQTFDEYQGIDKMKRVAKLMRQLHDKQQCIGYAFDPLARYENYAKHVRVDIVDEKTRQDILAKLQNMSYTPTLCHNDWVAGNICFTANKDYLIDYEYAGDNDPFFDVMSFITENTLTDEEKETFMVSYFGRPWTQEEANILHAYGDFHNLLWCTWAWMLYESRQDEVYLKIAQQKRDAILKRHPQNTPV